MLMRILRHFPCSFQCYCVQSIAADVALPCALTMHRGFTVLCGPRGFEAAADGQSEVLCIAGCADDGPRQCACSLSQRWTLKARCLRSLHCFFMLPVPCKRCFAAGSLRIERALRCHGRPPCLAVRSTEDADGFISSGVHESTKGQNVVCVRSSRLRSMSSRLLQLHTLATAPRPLAHGIHV